MIRDTECGRTSGEILRRLRSNQATPSILGFLMLLWLCSSIAAAAQEINVANTSSYIGEGRWEWTVYIVAPPEAIDKIKCVEYTLHPTFLNPVRQVCQPGDTQHPFGLAANGWGTFVVSIRVFFVDGRTTELKHMLTFVERPAEDVTELSADNVATKLREGLWEWTAFIQGTKKTLDQIKCVQYTLHPTFPNPVREVCDRGNGPHAFPLTTRGWGTFELKIRVFFADGRSLDLTHDLKF